MIRIQDSAIDHDDYVEFIIGLQELDENQPLCIFNDSLAVHKHSDVKAACEELGIMQIWNITYSPETNPIEYVFSQFKNRTRRDQL